MHGLMSNNNEWLCVNAVQEQQPISTARIHNRRRVNKRQKAYSKLQTTSRDCLSRLLFAFHTRFLDFPFSVGPPSGGPWGS